MADIDRVILINLERRSDKYFFALGRLSLLGFDVRPDIGQIVRFIAHEALDYQDIDSMREKAIADGFKEFGDARFFLQSVKHIAWCWTWRCALREVVKNNETVLFLIDDHLPTWYWTYDRFFRVLNYTQLQDRSHGFRMMQLMHIIEGNEPPEIMRPRPRESVIQKGLSGIGDGALILNADGAKLLLETAAEPPFGDPFVVFSTLLKRQNDPEIFRGLWHTIDDACEANHDWESDLDY